MAYTFWTEEEKTLLQSKFKYRRGYRAIKKALPHRSRRSIYQMARKLGLTKRSHWSQEEADRLRVLWGAEPLDRIAKLLDRTKAGVYQYAKHTLGLKVGCPNGWERMAHAAKRTGYMVETLKNILAHAGIKPSPSYSLVERKAKYHVFIVRPGDVDYAVSVWCDSETLFDAACRRGMCVDTLKSQLIESGLQPPAKKHAVWRIPSKDIDDAIKKSAEAKAKRSQVNETIRSAAERLGYKPKTLTVHLKRLGIPHGRWGVKRLDIDRIASSLQRREANPWTEVDLQKLAQLHAEGIDRGVIAAQMNRTRSAVTCKILSLTAKDRTADVAAE
jgi:hypothetical protein